MTKEEIEIRLLNLEKAFVQSQLNNVQTVERADKTLTLEPLVNNNSEEIEETNERTTDLEDIVLEMSEVVYG